MNSITIAGVLTRDTEVRFLPNGDPVAGFSVADNQAGKDKPAIFWNCQLYGKRAESLSQYLTKGQAVTVVGNITEREWNDKEGNKRKSMDVRVQDVALQGGRREESPRQAPNPSPRRNEVPEDDIPFADPLRNRAYCLCV